MQQSNTISIPTQADTKLGKSFLSKPVQSSSRYTHVPLNYQSTTHCLGHGKSILFTISVFFLKSYEYEKEVQLVIKKFILVTTQ